MRMQVTGPDDLQFSELEVAYWKYVIRTHNFCYVINFCYRGLILACRQAGGPPMYTDPILVPCIPGQVNWPVSTNIYMSTIMYMSSKHAPCSWWLWDIGRAHTHDIEYAHDTGRITVTQNITDASEQTETLSGHFGQRYSVCTAGTVLVRLYILQVDTSQTATTMKYHDCNIVLTDVLLNSADNDRHIRFAL